LATVLLLLVAASILINTRGAVSTATMRWGAAPQVDEGGSAARIRIFKRQKLWNWRHPQFLAGLTEP
jgi:hypothetical protein